MELLRLEVEKCNVVRRVNRFVVEVLHRDGVRKALLTNTGKLTEFITPKRKALCIRKRKGKTSMRLLAFEDVEEWAVVDTKLHAMIFERALERKLLPWVEDCHLVRREVQIGRWRLDYLLKCKTPVVAEMKSATMREGKYATYPDSPSERGRRHIAELIEIKKSGREALIFFASGLKGVEAFRPNVKVDPKIGELLKKAADIGVQIEAFSFFMKENGSVILDRPRLEIKL